MFAKPNPFDEIVTSATDENLTSENWELILSVCDKVTPRAPDSARDCVSAIQKRINHRNTNVQLYALTLAEALVKNCGIFLHREISSRSFTTALSKLIHDKSTHEAVRKRSLEFIQMCSFEFRNDASLGLMNEVYHSLRAEGITFPSPQKPKKEHTQSEIDKQKEEEELQLALALSLSESENRSSYRPSARAQTSASASRPTAETAQTAATPTPKPVEEPAPQVSRVRALYDFQPTEQGELAFQKGDIIRVIESVYRDWWKGELRGQTGIFPVNYVEKIVDPTPDELMKEAQMEAEVMNEIRNIERLLEILSVADPSKDSFSENEELQTLYNSTLSVRPKLVKLIEKYSLKKDELVALNEKFLQARTMYDHMLGSSIAKYTAPVGGFVSGQPYGGGNIPTYESQIQQQQQQPQGQPMYSAPPATESYQGYLPQQQQQQQQQQQHYPQGYPSQPSPAVHNQQLPQQSVSFAYPEHPPTTAPLEPVQQAIPAVTSSSPAPDVYATQSFAGYQNPSGGQAFAAVYPPFTQQPEQPQQQPQLQPQLQQQQYQYQTHQPVSQPQSQPQHPPQSPVYNQATYSSMPGYPGANQTYAQNY